MIFARFKEKNITLNFRKCEFRKEETTFLSHIISAHGIRPDPEKIQAIKDFNTPENKKQPQGFPGTDNFSTKFSKDIFEAISPILGLMKKGIKWHWKEEHQVAFERVKSLVCSEVMLHFPNSSQPYYLQTDASNYEIGAVLYQQDKESIKLIAWGSRTLRRSKLNYFTTEKELLALVWALQKYHSFLWGAVIIHRTDHMALTFSRSCKLISKRLTTWIMSIQDYQIQTEHCPGKENIIADAISRQTTSITEVEEKNITLNRLARRVDKLVKHDLLNLIEEQKNDPKLKIIREDITKQPDYRLGEDCLYKTHQGISRICLTSTIAEERASNCYKIYGHVGPRKCYFMLSEDFHCPELLKRIKKRLKTCHTCQINKVPTQSSFSPSQPIILSQPLEAVFTDFYGPLPAAKYGFLRKAKVRRDEFSLFLPILKISANVMLKNNVTNLHKSLMVKLLNDPSPFRRRAFLLCPEIPGASFCPPGPKSWGPWVCRGCCR